MSPMKIRFLVTMISVISIASIALLTGILELLSRALSLSEETLASLQRGAVLGQLLLLAIQAIEKIYTGYKVVKAYETAPESAYHVDVSNAEEEFEVCVENAPSTCDSSDAPILTKRILSKEDSFESATSENY